MWYIRLGLLNFFLFVCVGGVRGVGLVWSARLSRPGRVSGETFHIVDWLPTLLRAAGGYVNETAKIDGLDAWETLREDKESPRKVVLHNIDDIMGTAAITIDQWKLIKGWYIMYKLYMYINTV